MHSQLRRVSLKKAKIPETMEKCNRFEDLLDETLWPITTEPTDVELRCPREALLCGQGQDAHPKD